MARPLRIEIPGGLYHVTSRGDRREPIFADDDDRAALLAIVAQALCRFDASMFAYCLMGNHYHFVLQTPHGNLSRLMRHVNGVYAQAFNRRHGLVGHLFQGRFKAVHVDRDAYLLEVCRYTELNPVRARMVDAPGDWAWSSYRAHCGLIDSPAWLDGLTLLQCLSGLPIDSAADGAHAAQNYAAFVQAGMGIDLWRTSLRQEIYLGDDAFIRRTQERGLERNRCDSNVPDIQRRVPFTSHPPLKSASVRDLAMWRAYRREGMTLTQIAKKHGLSVSRVSRLMARLEGRAQLAPAR
jgi:putative transposase